jgi:hypothetical protein
MVDVAQLVEPRIVIPVVAGSIPVVHPIFLGADQTLFLHLFYKIFLCSIKKVALATNHAYFNAFILLRYFLYFILIKQVEKCLH